MAKQITESEKLVQLTLNRKYQELEQKEKEIKELNRQVEVLQLQLKEYKDTISSLCIQLNRLFLYHKNND